MESRSFSDQVYRRRPKQLEPCSEEDGSHLEDSKMICSEEHGWESDSALKIFVFSQQQFCRGCCMPTMPYKTLYLVHPIGSKTVLTSKEKALSRMNAWFLKSIAGDTSTALEWSG